MTGPASELIAAVEDDGSLYKIDKLSAHISGVRHLAVSVFVFSGNDLLIQQRAAGKYHCGLQWANTCCSHPGWGEMPAFAASRRLREELGCDVALTYSAKISYSCGVTDGLTENELVHIFRGTADKLSLALDPDPLEVAAVRWVDLSALRTEVRLTPQAFAPWFRIYLDRWPELQLG